MKTCRFTFAAVVCVLFAGLPVFAQGQGSSPATTTTAKGKLEFTFTITISSAIPDNSILVCTASASVESYQQSMVGIVQAPVAGKNICTVTMPYSWALANAATDEIALSYKAEVDYGYEVTASNGAGTLVEFASTDKVSANLTSIPVPTSATTKIAVTATL
jgi:hypothetical protein